MNHGQALADFVSDYGTIELDRLTLDQIVEVVIRRRLHKYLGNKTKAAQSLGVGRGTFRNWCEKYRITFDESSVGQCLGTV